VAFLVGDVIGPGGGSELIGNLAARIAGRAVQQTHGAQSAGHVLAEVNHELLGLGLEDPPLLAMLVGLLNLETGDLALARAGLPAPVYLSAAQAVETWPIPGPFLCTADTGYVTRLARLRPGDRLVIGTDGIRRDGNPDPAGTDRLLEVVANHCNRTGQSFVDAVARELLAEVTHEEDFTILGIEMTRA
jgi:serine phosphatase RsbU (regulator of sigma subunit)